MKQNEYTNKNLACTAHIKRGQTLKAGRIIYQTKCSPHSPHETRQKLRAGQIIYQAKFSPHSPHETREWHNSFVDSAFYTCEVGPLRIVTFLYQLWCTRTIFQHLKVLVLTGKSLEYSFYFNNPDILEELDKLNKLFFIDK